MPHSVFGHRRRTLGHCPQLPPSWSVCSRFIFQLLLRTTAYCDCLFGSANFARNPSSVDDELIRMDFVQHIGFWPGICMVACRNADCAQSVCSSVPFTLAALLSGVRTHTLRPSRSGFIFWTWEIDGLMPGTSALDRSFRGSSQRLVQACLQLCASIGWYGLQYYQCQETCVVTRKQAKSQQCSTTGTLYD
eukprot:TRINITY_DN5237_c1_g2_i2.p3 TRINITY_DN5237_c1_g2~~TRINITY_DN5237_c1_g2_i2.p3  ORF type:complete len:191 (-),score=4.73 TRINITY_DN5237_c1_g2_i2:171-743(-)